MPINPLILFFIRSVIITVSLFLFLVAEGTNLSVDPPAKIIGFGCSIIASLLMFFCLFSPSKTSFKPPNLENHRQTIAWSLIVVGSLSMLMGYAAYRVMSADIELEGHVAIGVLGGGMVLLSGIEILNRHYERSSALARIIGFLFVLSGGINTLLGLYIWWVFSPHQPNQVKEPQKTYDGF